MRKPKVKQKLTEWKLDADGFISDSDVPFDSRAEIELIKLQLNEFKRALNKPTDCIGLAEKENWNLTRLLQQYMSVMKR